MTEPRRRGMTLLELLVVVAILALLLTQTLPAPDAAGRGRRIVDAADALQAALARARAQARLDKRTAYLTVDGDGCYRVVASADCFCDDAACAPLARDARLPAGVALVRPAPPLALAFAAPRGLHRPDTLELVERRSGRRLLLRRSAFGRVRVCAPDAHAGAAPC